MSKIEIPNEKNKIFNQIQLKLRKINNKSKAFINDIILLINQKIGINHLKMLILFGSQTPENIKKKEPTQISDCDTLIILDDSIKKSSIQEVDKLITTLEEKYNFRIKKAKLSYRFLLFLQNSTGMFISHFITNEKYWKERNFSKIFSVNKLFSIFLAPKKIVLNNVIANSFSLYGPELDKEKLTNPELTPKLIEIFKSLIMNLLLLFGSTIFSPINNSSIKFQLEAVKWSLKTSNYYLFNDSKPLKIIIKRLISLKGNQKQKTKKQSDFYESFLKLRKNPINNGKFILLCPYYIIEIHINSIRFRRFIQKRKYNEIQNIL